MASGSAGEAIETGASAGVMMAAGFCFGVLLLGGMAAALSAARC